MRPDRFPSEFVPRRFDPIEVLTPLSDGGRTRYLDVGFAAIEGWRPLVLDLTVPASSDGAPIPVVIYIHGGAWLGGSNRAYPDDLIDIVPMWDLLLDAGFAVASITYRHSAEALFPACLHDVKAAIRWLRALGPRLGLDPDRIGVFGESAGAHLAALAAQPSALALEGDEGVVGVPSTVQAVVTWYAPTSFADVDSDAGPAALLIGGAPTSRPEAARAASPLSWVGPDSPPILLIHGDADSLVPAEQSRLLYERYLSVGAPAELVIVPGADHCFLGVDPAPLLQLTLEHFRRHL